MEIQKEAGVMRGGVPGEVDLKLIHGLSKRELQAEEVYTFCVRLCDNEIDRDGERFPCATLEQLATLFVGKSGVFDHQWSALGQTARIYRTELVREEHFFTEAGEAYCYLKGYAYMLRSEKNRDLIDEIEGGIKKEVSIGCAVKRAVCSICGGEMNACGHEKGRIYGGKRCWADLLEAGDAYEWSFVAVPAQRNAGVMKTMRRNPEEARQLEYQAALGRKYLEGLRKEVARLGRLISPQVDGETMAQITGKLEEKELFALKRGFEARLDRELLGGPQLCYDTGKPEGDPGDGAFLI